MEIVMKIKQIKTNFKMCPLFFKERIRNRLWIILFSFCGCLWFCFWYIHSKKKKKENGCYSFTKLSFHRVSV